MAKRKQNNWWNRSKKRKGSNPKSQCPQKPKATTTDIKMEKEETVNFVGLDQSQHIDHNNTKRDLPVDKAIICSTIVIIVGLFIGLTGVIGSNVTEHRRMPLYADEYRHNITSRMPLPFAMRDFETCIEILKTSVSYVYIRTLKYTYEIRLSPVPSCCHEKNIWLFFSHVGYSCGVVVAICVAAIVIYAIPHMLIFTVLFTSWLLPVVVAVLIAPVNLISAFISWLLPGSGRNARAETREPKREDQKTKKNTGYDKSKKKWIQFYLNYVSLKLFRGVRCTKNRVHRVRKVTYNQNRVNRVKKVTYNKNKKR